MRAHHCTGTYLARARAPRKRLMPGPKASMLRRRWSSQGPPHSPGHSSAGAEQRPGSRHRQQPFVSADAGNHAARESGWERRRKRRRGSVQQWWWRLRLRLRSWSRWAYLPAGTSDDGSGLLSPLQAVRQGATTVGERGNASSNQKVQGCLSCVAAGRMCHQEIVNQGLATAPPRIDSADAVRNRVNASVTGARSPMTTSYTLHAVWSQMLGPQHTHGNVHTGLKSSQKVNAAPKGLLWRRLTHSLPLKTKYQVHAAHKN